MPKFVVRGNPLYFAFLAGVFDVFGAEVRGCRPKVLHQNRAPRNSEGDQCCANSIQSQEPVRCLPSQSTVKY